MLLKLQRNIIYGPIQSRRLGTSLGINILPASQKTCTFNCLYCHYGWSEPVQPEQARNLPFPSLNSILFEVESALKKNSIQPDFITFSGNGEPTLHPGFEEIVQAVVALRNKYAPDSKTAILSNSSGLKEPGVIQALTSLDMAIMKLDAGNQKMFSLYNQPERRIGFESIVDHLAGLENITIQALLSKGEKGNMQPSDLRDWLDRLKKISPKDIQIYTLDRTAPCREIDPVSRFDLLAIKSLLKKENLPAMVF